MLHTLLSPKERAQIRHEYRVRLAIVTLFAISVVGVAGIASLFPAFMRGILAERVELEAITSLEEDRKSSGVVGIQEELLADKALLSVLAENLESKSMSEEVMEIVSFRKTNKITSMQIEKGDKTVRIVLQGTAPTRDALLEFKSRIESGIPGAAVTLPLSQLAQSTNIKFTIEIIEAMQ